MSNSIGSNPTLQDYRTRLSQGPALREGLQQATAQQTRSGKIDTQAFQQLRSQYMQQLGVDPNTATPEQLKAIDVLIADSLDGQIDEQQQVPESERMVSQLAESATQATQRSEFEPVSFTLQPPATAEAEANAVVFPPVTTPDGEIIQPTAVPETESAALPAEVITPTPTGQDTPTRPPIPPAITALKTASPEARTTQVQALIAQLNPAQAAQPDQGQLMAAILHYGSPAQKTEALNKLLSPHNADSAMLIKAYDQIAQGAAQLELGSGVMATVATQHFAKLSGANADQVRFQVLMKIEDKSPPANDFDTPPHAVSTLRPLLEGLSREQRMAIRAQAAGVVAGFNRQVQQDQQNSGTSGVGGGGNVSVVHNYTRNEFDRAQRIIKIIDWLNNRSADAPPTKPQPVQTEPVKPQPQPANPTPPPVVETPVTPTPPAPVVETPPPTVEEPTTPPVTEEPPPPPPFDFSTQVFLERMRRFQSDRNLDALLENLNGEDKNKLIQQLDACADGRFTKPDGTHDELPVPSAEAAKETLRRLGAEGNLDAEGQGRLAAALLQNKTDPAQAFSVLRKAHEAGKFPDVMRHLQVNGSDQARLIAENLSPEDAGKALAWMATAPAEGPLEHQMATGLQRASSFLVKDDNVTRAFLREVQHQTGKAGEQGLEVLKDRLSPDLVRKLTDNLNTGWVTREDQEFLTQLSAAAGTRPSNAQVQGLLRQGNLRNAMDILRRSSPEDRAAVVADMDKRQLSSVLSRDPAAFAEIVQGLETYARSASPGARAGVESSVRQLLEQVPNPQALDKLRTQLQQRNHTEFSEGAREVFFKRALETRNFADTRDLLRGGELSPAAKGRMYDHLASNLNRLKAEGEVPEAMSWILANGTKNQVETAFATINQGFGPGKGRIVTEIMDKHGAALKGRLSLDTIQHMTGSLNNFSAKVGSATGWTRLMGDFNENAKHIRELAQLGDTNAKAAIVRDLMDYWTPGTAETLIHDVLRNTTDRAEFTRLVNQVGTGSLSGPQRLADELENRGEQGRLMATILERYDGDAKGALNQMMGRWKSTSIQSDDIVHAMLKQLETDRKLPLLRERLDRPTIDTLIDWTDDAFRDGNIMNLDPESQWSVNTLQRYRP